MDYLTAALVIGIPLIIAFVAKPKAKDFIE